MSPDRTKDLSSSALVRVATWLFYGGLSLLVVLCATGMMATILPDSLARRVAYNSEAYLFAVALAGWIQFALPRLAEAKRLPLGLAVGALWAVIGVGMVLSDLPSSVRTLNETAFALAVLTPYVSLRRPVAPWWLTSIPGIVVLVVYAIAWAPQSWVIDQAETWGFLVLTVLALDVVDRSLLNPHVQTSAGRRWGLCAFLLLEPVIVSGLGTGMREGDGAMAATLEFLGRVHESFFGVLLLVLALSLLPRKFVQESDLRRSRLRQHASFVSSRD